MRPELHNGYLVGVVANDGFAPRLRKRMKTSSEFRITIISDTHELHRKLDPLPGGDLLIHCGDFSLFSKNQTAIEDFANWLRSQPYRHKIVTYGNHEFLFEAAPEKASVFGNDVHVLNGQGVIIDGLKIWASAVTPLYGGAFGLSSPADRERYWQQIPPNTDILITHGPPAGILDRASQEGLHVGDPELRAAVERLKPRLHCFGHVHGATGIQELSGTTFINAALAGQEEILDAKPFHLRLSRL